MIVHARSVHEVISFIADKAYAPQNPISDPDSSVFFLKITYRWEVLLHKRSHQLHQLIHSLDIRLADLNGYELGDVGRLGIREQDIEVGAQRC